MYGRPDPPEPKLWKALLVAALFCFPLSCIVRAFVSMSDIVWFVVASVMTLVAGYSIHQRVTDDWRAQYTLNYHDFNARTSVERNIRSGRR